MSATLDVPKGLDKLDASDQALLDAMRNEDPSPEAEADDASPEPELAPEATEETPDFEIDDPPPAPEKPTKKTFNDRIRQLNLQRKAAEDKAAAAEAKLNEERAVLQARVDMIAKLAEQQAAVPAPAPPAAKEPEVPDRATDPIGHFAALYDRAQAKIQDLEATTKAVQNQMLANQRIAEMRAWAGAQENDFAAREPSYREAMDFLRKSRGDELAIIGVTDPAQREKTFADDINAIAARARQENGNFAERLYKLAESRGFKKIVAAPKQPEIPPLDAPVPDKAERLERARENSTTLGTVGSAPATKLSVERIAAMSETEFAALIKRLDDNPQALRRLLGE